ncbi:MAG: RCC1 repeat-containing protein, partial [Planctomycetota bacterium]
MSLFARCVLILLAVATIQAAEPMTATGLGHALYLADDGTVWAWGSNSNGQLGQGDTTPRYEPVQVPGLDRIVQIAAGNFHSMALRADGRVYTWGYNAYGQIGNGTSGTDALSPVLITLFNAKQISAGAYHCLALHTNGTITSWGYNGTGCVGDGTTTSPVTSPTTVVGGLKYRAVCGGGLHSMAIRDDGTVWAWGWDTYGQLGDDAPLTSQSSPVQVATINNALSLAAGYFHSIAVLANGNVYTWGRDANGQLGN